MDKQLTWHGQAADLSNALISRFGTTLTAGHLWQHLLWTKLVAHARCQTAQAVLLIAEFAGLEIMSTPCCFAALQSSHSGICLQDLFERSLYHQVAPKDIEIVEYRQGFMVVTVADCQGPETLFRQICDRVKHTQADFRLEVSSCNVDFSKEELLLCLFSNPRFGLKLQAGTSSRPGMVQSFLDEAHLDWTALRRPVDIFFRMTNEGDIDDITGPRGRCSDLSSFAAFTNDFQGFVPK